MSKTATVNGHAQGGGGGDGLPAGPASNRTESWLTYVWAALYLLLSPLRPLLDRLLFALLSVGPIPQHIGIIMDGNRRFARNHPGGPIPVSQGHLSGFNALRSVLEACLRLRGMTTVTVFAFAINNFARDKTEVDAIMELAKSNLIQLAGHGEVLARHSVRLRMIGRKELLPSDVRRALEKVERMTEGNRRATLNICIAYAATDEVALAVERSIKKREALPADVDTATAISVKELDSHMMLAHSPPVDIMIRTSNVHRLSDFMLWQVRICRQSCAQHLLTTASITDDQRTAAVHPTLLAAIWAARTGPNRAGLPENGHAAVAGGAHRDSSDAA